MVEASICDQEVADESLVNNETSECGKQTFRLYTGMDITCLYTSSGSLFVRLSGCPRHVGRNYVLLFGVQTALHN